MSTVVKDLGAVSAYAYAVEKGYTGTEAEFAELMADYAEVGQRAEDAADSALESKTAAQTAATTATNKASEATTAAQTATTKAGEASTSASQASASATTASTKASEASQSASTASAKATEAAQSATNAQTYANTAQAAQTAAETAQGKAEDAQAAAEAVAESIPSDYSQLSADVSDVKENLSTLNTEGTVPTSKQMLSDNYSVDSVPYHFRKTASDNADREELETVGGSVAWNQLVQNGDFADTTGWSVYNSASISANNNILTISMTAQANSGTGHSNVSLIKGHKYFKTVDIKSSVAVRFDVEGVGTKTSSGSNQWEKLENIVDWSNYNTNAYTVFVRRSVLGDSAASADVKNCMIFDLTAMFGPTIADHIYSLEQATAGAGVALFKSLFPKDYYAYDAGSMQSVSGLSEHRTVGKNLIDVTATTTTVQGVTFTVNEDKSITANGTSTGWNGLTVGTIKAPAGDYVFIDSLDNSSCFLEIIVNGQSYDTRYAARRQVTLVSDSEITVKAYVISGGTVNGLTMYPMFCRADVDDSYEPYNGHSYALDDSLTLRGIPTLVNGKIKWDGDVYKSDGKVTRRFGIVDLGTLTWAKHDTYTQCFSANASALNMASPSSTGNKGICTAYNVIYGASVTLDVITASSDSLFVAPAVWSASTPYIVVNDDSYTDAASFKAAMSGVYLVYPLATPTTEQADPYISPQICHYDGTEEFVSTGIVPVGHNTKYPDNLRMKLDNLPWNFASLIAPTESAYKATRNYTTGALLIVNNVLYKATANIANGGNITVGTNVIATTLAEVISALS